MSNRLQRSMALMDAKADVKIIKERANVNWYDTKMLANAVYLILEELTATNTADTPQTDCDDCIWNVCNYNKVEWDADTPQNEQMKTADYCDICKQDMCKDCIADATNPYCVPSHYEINYTPQTEYDKYREKIRPHDPHKDWLEDEPQTDCGWK